MGITRSEDGKYHIKGKVFELLIGSRAQVWHETAYKTSGGLTRADLFQNKKGRIVSSAKHSSAKRDNRLIKYGFGFMKGKFGTKRITPTIGKKQKKVGGGTKKNRGGGLIVM